MRILVVEDELHLQKTICKRLEMEHYSVDACDNGLEALDYIEMTPYDIIILDIMALMVWKCSAEYGLLAIELPFSS